MASSLIRIALAIVLYRLSVKCELLSEFKPNLQEHFQRSVRDNITDCPELLENSCLCGSDSTILEILQDKIWGADVLCYFQNEITTIPNLPINISECRDVLIIADGAVIIPKGVFNDLPDCIRKDAAFSSEKSKRSLILQASHLEIEDDALCGTFWGNVTIDIKDETEGSKNNFLNLDCLQTASLTLNGVGRLNLSKVSFAEDLTVINNQSKNQQIIWPENKAAIISLNIYTDYLFPNSDINQNFSRLLIRPFGVSEIKQLNRNLPSFMSEKLEVLDISGSGRPDLINFPFVTSPNLGILHLPNNRISDLSNLSIENLPNLIHLSLFANQITVVPKGLFYSQLRAENSLGVNLYDNPIAKLEELCFRGCDYISLSYGNQTSISIQDVPNQRHFNLPDESETSPFVEIFLNSNMSITGLDDGKIKNKTGISINFHCLFLDGYDGEAKLKCDNLCPSFTRQLCDLYEVTMGRALCEPLANLCLT